MRKTLALLALAGVASLSACGGGENTNNANTNTNANANANANTNTNTDSNTDIIANAGACRRKLWHAVGQCGDVLRYL
jgi:protein involved in sex pheromone biosynthesis